MSAIYLVRKLPGKSSAADPLPIPVLKEVADVVAPFVSELFKRSLSAGYFPICFKEAFSTSVIKKPGLDAADANLWPEPATPPLFWQAASLTAWGPVIGQANRQRVAADLF